MSPGTGMRPPDADDLADAILGAGRVLLQLSAECLRSLWPELSLSEFRVVVLLSELGPQRLIDVAAALDVTPTTATRLADRLAGHGLVDRVRQSRDRREIHLAVAPAGRALVGAVQSRRRRFVSSALADFAEREREAALAVLARLAEVTVPNENEKESA